MSKRKKNIQARPWRKKIAAPRIAPLRREIQTREVDDPDFSRDHEIGYAGNRRTTRVAINVRESAVETLYARRFLAASQKRAADRFRETWEAAGGKIASFDYTLSRVDGGRGDPLAGRLRAARELQRCRTLLGVRGYEIIVKVCAEGHALTEISPHKRDRLTIADNLRADLDDLSAMWHLRTRPRRF